MYHPTSEQDWTPVVLKTKPQTLAQAQRTNATETKQKPHNHNHQTPTKSLEKDLHTDPTQEAPALKPLPRLSQEEKLKLTKARTDKHLTQAQLAQQVNVPASVIAGIEAGKVIENKEVLTRIGRVLGVKIKC